MARPSAPSSSRSTRGRSHLLDRRIDVVDEGRATTGAVLMVLNEWSGELTDAQWSAYRRHDDSIAHLAIGAT
jgi:hypothetical protein